MDDNVFDFEEHKNKIKKSVSTSQKEAEKILQNSKPITARDIMQLELIESLADHVVFLTKMLQELLERDGNLEENSTATVDPE